MRINPLNVLQLLLITFQGLKIEISPVTQAEIELKEKLEQILLDAMNEFNGIEVIEEETLAFQEPYKDVQMEIVEDNDRIWGLSDDDECSIDSEDLSHDYKMRAVEFWRSGQTKNLALKTVQNRFRKVKSITQLKRWAHTLNKGGTYREKIGKICQYVLENFRNSVEAGHIVHDIDLQRWALQAQREIGHEDIRFRASAHWVKNFKRAHRIVSRKINKFVTKKTLEGVADLQQKADDFVSEIQRLLREKGSENVFNSDQSAFQLEIHSGRTLAVEGEQQIQCLVQSVSSISHSYTIQPLISADGKLLSPLFIVLKEQSGQFGPLVTRDLFKPSNVYVMASKSGKLTSDHFRTWLKDVYFPHVGSSSVLLIDSWSGHCSAVSNEVTPPNKEVLVKLIPKGTTGKIQPLDVYGFRMWKNYVRHFSDSVMLMNEELNLHLRNNIIKLQSLVHNQFSSPRYINLFKFSWYKSGYIDEKPGDFENPVKFGFQQNANVRCEVDGCSNIAITKCSWCKKSLCLKHFFHEYHYCTDYKP